MKVLIGANPMGLEAGIPALQKEFPDVEFVHCPERDQTESMIGDADVYMGWLSREAFLAGKKLKWVQSPSSGINYYLDIPEMIESDVLLTSAAGTHGAAVAESAMAMILAFTRGVRSAIIDQPSKAWNNRTIRPTMMELTGTVMGIVGAGAIGRALAKRAKAFEMRVISLDLYPNNKSEYMDDLWGLDRMDAMLEIADFVVITVPYTQQTANSFGAAQMAKMKQGSMLVVMSRGGIVDEDALVDALKSGHLGSAALDVFKPEPLPENSELWTLPNVLCAPHIAGGTQYEGKYVLDIFAENLRRLRAGQTPLRNQVDKQAGF